MRDHLYRICEQAHNKNLSKLEIVQLMQRSQDLTLGVLAIEQLTGAIVARQPILSAGANADASANTKNTQKELEDAKKDEAAKKAAIKPLEEASTKADEGVTEAQKNAIVAKANAADAISKIEAKKPELYIAQATESQKLETLKNAQGEEDKLRGEIDELSQKIAKETDQGKKAILTAVCDQKIAQLNGGDKSKPSVLATKTAYDAWFSANKEVAARNAEIKELKNDQTYVAYAAAQDSYNAATSKATKEKADLDQANSDYADAQTVTASITGNLDASIVAAKSANTTVGNFSVGNERNNVNKDTVAQIATATQNIVETIVTKGRLTDACTNFMASYLVDYKNFKDFPTNELNKYQDLCAEVYRANIEVYKRTAGINPGPVVLTTNMPEGKGVAQPSPKQQPPARVGLGRGTLNQKQNK